MDIVKIKTKKNKRSNEKDEELIECEGIKKKKSRKWNKHSVIDKNKLTMFDLISYNPPPSSTKNSSEEINLNDKKENDLIIDPNNEEVLSEEDKEDECIGPRVKINENGEIIIDEQSLIVKRKKIKDKNVKTVYEDDKSLSTVTTYSSFKKPGKINSEKKLRWTDDETIKFYTALTIIGTDFTMMSELFFKKKRSRVDLKNKFKQEEKFHKVLIDNALKNSDLTSIGNAEYLDILQSSGLSSDESDTETVNSKEKFPIE